MRGHATNKYLCAIAILAIAIFLSGCYATRVVENNLIPDHRAHQPLAAPVFFPAFIVATAVDVVLFPITAWSYEKDGRKIPVFWDHTLKNSWAGGQPGQPTD